MSGGFPDMRRSFPDMRGSFPDMSTSFRDNRQPFSVTFCQNPFVFDILAFFRVFPGSLIFVATDACHLKRGESPLLSVARWSRLTSAATCPGFAIGPAANRPARGSRCERESIAESDARWPPSCAAPGGSCLQSIPGRSSNQERICGIG
jgi:hypothetical protein